MKRALEAHPDEDLGDLVRYLRERGVDLRVYEEQGRQVLDVALQIDVERVQTLYGRLKRGEIAFERRTELPQEPAHDSFGVRVRQVPVTVLGIILSVVAYPFVVTLSEGQVSSIAQFLLIVDVTQGVDVSLQRLMDDGQYWRWLTPVFVHFSITHIAFNCAIWWMLGERIERGIGSLPYLIIAILISVVANIAQVTTDVSPLFGGASGLAYGMLGFVLIMNRLEPQIPNWQLHPGFAISLLLFLLVFSTGITEQFGLHVANAAHWAGLLSGGLLAMGLKVVRR